MHIRHHSLLHRWTDPGNSFPAWQRLIPALCWREKGWEVCNSSIRTWKNSSITGLHTHPCMQADFSHMKVEATLSTPTEQDRQWGGYAGTLCLFWMCSDSTLTLSPCHGCLVFKIGSLTTCLSPCHLPFVIIKMRANGIWHDGKCL